MLILLWSVYCISSGRWINLPAVTREDRSTPNLLQFSDDPYLLFLPGRHDSQDCVEALMVEKSADALQPKQLQHSDGLSDHAARKNEWHHWEEDCRMACFGAANLDSASNADRHMLCRPDVYVTGSDITTKTSKASTHAYRYGGCSGGNNTNNVYSTCHDTTPGKKFKNNHWPAGFLCKSLTGILLVPELPQNRQTVKTQPLASANNEKEKENPH